MQPEENKISDSSFFKYVVSEEELDTLDDSEKPKPEFDKGELNYVI